ncbi:MAG TPA: hypothetical protein VM427_05815 [Patescibacteria group bacterium]|nr:hypothetical protein [Patescibacteria group bacterium]
MTPGATPEPFVVIPGRGTVEALHRKLALKERDGDVDRVILLLADTRHNRVFLRGSGSSLRTRFPLDGRQALMHLAAGTDPGASAIVLL